MISNVLGRHSTLRRGNSSTVVRFTAGIKPQFAPRVLRISIYGGDESCLFDH